MTATSPSASSVPAHRAWRTPRSVRVLLILTALALTALFFFRAPLARYHLPEGQTLRIIGISAGTAHRLPVNTSPTSWVATWASFFRSPTISVSTPPLVILTIDHAPSGSADQLGVTFESGEQIHAPLLSLYDLNHYNFFSQLQQLLPSPALPGRSYVVFPAQAHRRQIVRLNARFDGQWQPWRDCSITIPGP